VAQAPAAEAEAPAKKASPKKDADRKKQEAEDEYFELYKVFADTMYQVEQNYVKDIDRRELMEAAIRGVLEKLDPYSNYISPEEISRFKTSVDSQFGGIGIQITIEGGQLKILSPLVGSPAYRAGLQAGDAILEINGKSTERLAIDDAVKQLKGDVGTSVELEVQHPRGGSKETVKIDREIIQIETVMGDRRKEDDSWDFMLDPTKKIGYIRITAFSRDTSDDVELALKELKKQDVQGLVIDLRFNPGGLLKSATDIADLFVTDGLIVKTIGRNTAPREINARKAGTYEGFPIAVLVNRYSASASEIVSACLQDHHRAVVIGERTWGKGSVQNVIDLEEGKSALKLTTASYWRPSGKNIHRFPDSKESDEWGVKPDKGFDLRLSDSEMVSLQRDRRDRDILLVNHFKKDSDASPKKTTDSKPAETEEEGDAGKPAAEKDSEPSKAKATDHEKSDKAGKSDTKADKSDADGKDATKGKKPAFVDRQLQKALEYLDGELAKKASRD
jgi:carboxyl-terminal processing protease